MTLRWLLTLPSLYRGIDYYRHTRDHSMRVIALDYSIRTEEPGVFAPIFRKNAPKECRYCADEADRFYEKWHYGGSRH